MSDPDQPKQPRKGQFQKGNKFAKGRPKGSENKFGPGFREKLLAGITASGEKKARKAGVNGKIDGFTYYIENLVDNNSAAAATLISKMMPPETPPIKTPGGPLNVNVISVLEGNMWAPGKTLLLPYDECGEAHTAYRSGAEAWQAYLEKIKPQLPLEAFEKLSGVPLPTEPNNVVNLRNHKPDTDKNDDDNVA